MDVSHQELASSYQQANLALLIKRALAAELRAALAEQRAAQAEQERDEQYHRAEDLASKLEWSQQSAQVRAYCPNCKTLRDWYCSECNKSWPVN